MYWFIGIKGTGMAALATMLHDLGNEVAGSDLEKHFFTEDELVKRGIQIYPFCKDNIKDGYTVIIGNAFLEDFEEVQAARSNPTCTCYRYHEFLGKLIGKLPFGGDLRLPWQERCGDRSGVSGDPAVCRRHLLTQPARGGERPAALI